MSAIEQVLPLDPEPWLDDRPSMMHRGPLPWGHAHFLPRVGFEQEPTRYGPVFDELELREAASYAAETLFASSVALVKRADAVEWFMCGALWMKGLGDASDG